MVLVVKNPPDNAGDVKVACPIPGLGRSPGGGHGNPLQYSCLEGPMDRGAWWARVHGVTKSRTRLSTRICSVLQQRPDSCEFFCFFALGFIVLLGSVGLEFSSNSENWGPLFLHIFLLSLPLFLLFGNSTSRYGRPLEVVRAVDVLFIS